MANTLPRFGLPSRRGRAGSPFGVSSLTPTSDSKYSVPVLEDMTLYEAEQDADHYPVSNSEGQIKPAKDDRGKNPRRTGQVHINFIQHLFGANHSGWSNDNILMVVNLTGEKLRAGEILVIPGEDDDDDSWNTTFEIPNGIRPKKYFNDPTAVIVMIDSDDEKEVPVPCHTTGPRWAKVTNAPGNEPKIGDSLGTSKTDEKSLFSRHGELARVVGIDPDDTSEAQVVLPRNIIVADWDNDKDESSESTFINGRNKARNVARLHQAFRVFNKSELTGDDDRVHTDDELGLNCTAGVDPTHVPDQATKLGSSDFHKGLFLWAGDEDDPTFGHITHIIDVIESAVTTAKINTISKYKTEFKAEDPLDLNYQVAAIRHDAQFRMGDKHGRIYFKDEAGEEGCSIPPSGAAAVAAAIIAAGGTAAQAAAGVAAYNAGIAAGLHDPASGGSPAQLGDSVANAVKAATAPGEPNDSGVNNAGGDAAAAEAEKELAEKKVECVMVRGHMGPDEGLAGTTTSLYNQNGEPCETVQWRPVIPVPKEEPQPCDETGEAGE